MRAVVMRAGRLEVDDVDDPVPGPGQLLVQTLACGICGSDLHALRHGDELVEMSQESSGAADVGLGEMPIEVMDLDHDVVMGHEFAAEVIELGDDVGNARVGDVVVSMPAVLDLAGVHPLGYSNAYPGGYAERMVLNDVLALRVPDGFDPRHAALTEPMAVGLHAVNRSGIAPGTAAVVLGCGPVGLAVVAALAAAGIEPIVASDFSATRRSLASGLGAHEVVDPRDEPPVDAWRRIDGSRPLVIYEAVGVPGMIDDAMRAAPRHTQLLVVGACMQADTIRPMRGVAKELQITFAFSYEPAEFAETLRRIVEDELDVAPLVTGVVDLEGVPDAFVALADPDAQAKVLVVPARG